MESAGLGATDFTTSDTIFQMGRPPRRIDVITGIDGVTFEEAWPNRVTVEVEGIQIPCLGRRELVRNKRATGRAKDLLDLELLKGSG